MGEYDRQIANAQRLIARKGQLVTWRQQQRTPDPAKPWEVTSAPVDYAPSICFLPVDKETRQFVNYLTGSNETKVGSVIGLMGNVAFEPSASDVVIRDGKTLEIANIELLSPNGQKVLYTIEFKG